MWVIENPDVIVDIQKEYIKQDPTPCIHVHLGAIEQSFLSLDWGQTVEINKSWHSFQGRLSEMKGL